MLADEHNAKSSQIPFPVFSIILQMVLAQEIYNICLHTLVEFSSQLARIGNSSPEANIRVAFQKVCKNAHEKRHLVVVQLQ